MFKVEGLQQGYVEKFSVGAPVMVMLGEHHPSRGEITEVKAGDRKLEVKVRLEQLWPPDAPATEVWFDDIDLLVLEPR